MNLLRRLLDFALENFYPKEKVGDYSSKYDMWVEWLSSEYINGRWYIGEVVDESIGFLNRDVGKIYMVEEENRYSLGVELINFNPAHSLDVKLTYRFNDKEYSDNIKVTRYLSSSYSYLSLPVSISYDNLIKITVNCKEVVDNHLTYSSINSKDYLKEDIIKIDKELFLELLN